ncbi:MAG: hypothetical protein LBS87_00940, partial [Puniceicoccales bacterium]|nr:hypothetical protein [Puniceicoccales bacterium]
PCVRRPPGHFRVAIISNKRSVNGFFMVPAIIPIFREWGSESRADPHLCEVMILGNFHHPEGGVSPST